MSGNSEKTIVERGELVRTSSGNLVDVNKSVPLHEDTKVVNYGNVPSGKGGLIIDAQSVLSNSYAHARNGDRKMTEQDEILSLKPKEVYELSKNEFGLKLKTKPDSSLSMAESAKHIIEQRDKELDLISRKNSFRIKNKELLNPKTSQDSALLTDIFAAMLPTSDEIFDKVMGIQESLKFQNEELFKDQDVDQYGGYRGFKFQKLKDGNWVLEKDPKAESTPLKKPDIAQYGNGPDTISEDRRSDFKRWLDSKTVDFRTVALQNKQALEKAYVEFDKQYPTTKDKINAASAVLSYAPHPIVRNAASLVNLGVDVLDKNTDETSADFFSFFAGLSNKPQHKIIQLGTKAAKSLFDAEDITNSKLLEDSPKAKTKQFGLQPKISKADAFLAKYGRC